MVCVHVVVKAVVVRAETGSISLSISIANWKKAALQV